MTNLSDNKENLTTEVKQKRAKREEYTEIIKYISSKSNFSFTKVSTILTQFSKELQLATKRGEIIHLEGVCKIKFTSKKGKFYKFREFNIQKQHKYVASELGYSLIDVYNCISLYMLRIKELIYKGYRVNIKGIGYIEPYINENNIIELKKRVSPMLEKPYISEFVLIEKGEVYIDTLTQKDLRFKMELCETLQLPKKILSEEETTLCLEYVDI